MYTGGFISSFMRSQWLKADGKKNISGVKKHILKHSISAIVPAYNEEKKIKPVLDALVKSKYLHEVICVNDGSTDKTLEEIKKVKSLKIINLQENHGKAYAISRGILKAQGDIVLFVDADITGLKSESLKSLIRPLISGKFDAAVGYIEYNCNGIAKRIYKPFNGERTYFKKDLLPHINKIKNAGYGLELYLNYAFKDKKVKIINLKNVGHIQKYEKQPLGLVIKLTIKEILDIADVVFRQKNPVLYFLSSYLPFYCSKSSLVYLAVNKYLGLFYENVQLNYITPYSFRRNGLSSSKSTALYTSIISLTVVFIYLSLIFTQSANYKNLDKFALNSKISSYKKYENIFIANVVEPVKSKYLKNILSTQSQRTNNYTTGFVSS